MKILLLIRQLGIGGAEKQLVNLAKGLNARGVEVRVAVFYGEGEMEPELFESGIPIVHLNKKGRWDNIAFAVRYLRLVNNFKPDIVYGFLTGPNLCAILSRFLKWPTRIVWGLRTSTSDDLIRNNDIFVSISFRLSIWFSFLPHKIILNSFSSHEYYLKKGLNSRKLIVVPNGIDTSRFYYDADSGKHFRKTNKIPQKAILIGMVARIDPVKDHYTFLVAARQLHLKYPSTYFVVVGTGETSYVSELKSLSASTNLGEHLLWTGQVSNLPSIYNALDVNTLTSKSESSPNVICEAMACGTPCVSTNVGDCKNIIGEFGHVIPIGDVHSLVIAWEAMLFNNSDSNASFRHKAISHISNNYSMPNMIDTTIDLFKTALNEKTP